MRRYLKLASILFLLADSTFAQNGMLVFQTDFGLKDGAVSAMKGVAMSVDAQLKLFDLTHEIPAYNIWEAALRLEQASAYWPKGTVFVSVVDPGVGSRRKSVVLQTRSGHFFVSPDNGSLSLVAEQLGIQSLREIDESINRLPGSGDSYTFHGRDVYSYTGARLASGHVSYSDIGKLLEPAVVSIPYQKAVLENSVLKGTISILDVQYGNIWSNIGQQLLQRAGINNNDTLQVRIFNQTTLVYEGRVLYASTFSAVPPGSPVSYLNSLLNFSLAINLGNFAELYKIGSGPSWSIEVKKN